MRGAAKWPLRAIVLMMLLAACSPNADRIHVIAVGTGWPAELVGLDRERSSPDARALQDILGRLPSRDERRISCPVDDGRRVHVDLVAGASTVATFEADVSGCRYVRRDGRILESSEEFWSALARAAALTPQQLR
jgi:hypothetical protein